MVTPAYIRSLRADAQIWTPIDVAVLEERIIDYLDRHLPDWDRRADSLLRRSVPLIAMQVQVIDEERLHQARRGLLAYAEGPDLDLLGLGPPVILRRAGEVDEDYRIRIADARLSLSLGSLAYEEALARQLQPALTDVLAVVGRNRQDVYLYALTGQREAITSEERRALDTEMNRRDAQIAGVVVTAATPTEVPYTIDIEATYDAAATDGADLERRIRESIYEFLGRTQRIGHDVYRSAIQEAAWVEEVLDLALSSPVRDLAPPSVRIIPAAADPGTGAEGYPDIVPTDSTGRATMHAIVLTRQGIGYEVAPIARVTDDMGQTIDYTTELEGGSVSEVTIPHPQSLLWYAYPSESWAAIYTCDASAADVRITVTPKVTPATGRVSLAEGAPTVSIVGPASVIPEGSDITYTISVDPVRPADLTVLVDVSIDGPAYGITAGRRQVVIPAGDTAIDLTLSTTRSGVIQDLGEITAAIASQPDSYEIDPAGSSVTALVGTRYDMVFHAVGVPASVSRGNPAEWIITLASAIPVSATQPVIVTVTFDIEQSPDGVVADRYIGRGQSVDIDMRPVAQGGDAGIGRWTIPTESDAPTGTVTMLLQTITGPTTFFFSGFVSGHPVPVTVQLT